MYVHVTPQHYRIDRDVSEKLQVSINYLWYTYSIIALPLVQCIRVYPSHNSSYLNEEYPIADRIKEQLLLYIALPLPWTMGFL